MDASQVSEDISKTTNHNKDYEGFYDSLKRGAELLLNIPKNKNIRVIGYALLQY
jgi:shikimate 5-dehydrogenase